MNTKITTLDLDMSLFSSHLARFLLNSQYGTDLLLQIKQVIDYQNNGDYDSALMILDKNLQIMQECSGITSNYIYIMLQHYIADCHLHNNNPYDAIEVINMALFICDTNQDSYMIQYQCKQRLHLHRKYICDIVSDNENSYEGYKKYKEYALESKQMVNQINQTHQYQYIQCNIKSIFNECKQCYTSHEDAGTIMCDQKLYDFVEIF